jgi:outer membrane receptor protein involved in Fe transport
LQKLILRPQVSPPVNDLGLIKLKISATLLKEAEITADKSFVLNNIDRKTYNTDQLSVTAGGNVNDVLQNIPSVEVDADGGVSLRGNENVTILIDGRPSGMTGAGGKSLLESIPATAIEKVEVITNPSAKYDPDGISGIINIITKKNKLQGFTGNVGTSTSFGGRYTANTSLNYRKGKWNVYTNYGFTHDIRNNTGNSYRETFFNDVTDYLDQEDKGKTIRNSHNIKAGADYNIAPATTISASVLFNSQHSNSDSYVLYNLYGATIDTMYKRITKGNENENGADFDVSMRHNFKKEGRILNLQGTASVSANKNSNNYDQQGYLDEQTPLIASVPLLEKDQSDEYNYINTISAGYEHPLGKDKKLEAGYKSTFREFDTDYRAQYYNPQATLFVNDINRTNHFIYNDRVHAVYAQYRQSISKFGFQAGLRSEYAETESKLETTREFFTKDYYSLFPSAFITYAPKEKLQLKASYSRRINRPRKQALNPFSDFDDPLNIRKGNPYLDPEYTDSYELEGSKYFGRLSLTATGYMRITRGYIQRFREVQPSGITITTFQNLAQSRNYGLELILNGNLFKWWNLTFSTNMFRNEVDATNLQQDLASTSFSLSGRIFTSFRLPYNTELQLSYFYRAPVKLPQGTMKDMQNFTIAATRKILKDKAIITLKVTDPFNVQRFGFEYNDTFYIQDITRKRESRFITIGFTYRFGELKDRERTRKEQPSREEMEFGE